MKGIKFYADTPPEGCGIAARRMIAGLDRRGVPVTFVPEFGAKHEAGARVRADPLLARLAGRKIDYDTVVFHGSPDHWPRLAALEPGKTLIGATVWETDRPPAHWREAARAVSGTIVPCEWNRRVFVDAGWPVPVEVVPHIAPEPQEMVPTPPARRLGIRRPDVMFYTIGVWSSRKALAETVTAFCRAVRWRRRAVLVLKTTPLDLATEIRHRARVPSRVTARLLTLATAPWCRVKLLTGSRPAGEVAWLHERGDCYLNFSHGEGWGLGLFDACAAGNPAITTAHGGPLDYIGAEAHRIGWREVPVRPRNYERAIFTAGMHWAEPDWDEAVARIREVCDDPAGARRRAAPAGDRIRRDFGWGPMTERLLGAIGRMRTSGGASPAAARSASLRPTTTGS